MKKFLMMLVTLVGLSFPVGLEAQQCAAFLLNISSYTVEAWYEVVEFGAQGSLGVVQPGQHQEIFGPCTYLPIRFMVLSQDPNGEEQVFDMSFVLLDGTLHRDVFAIVVDKEEIKART